MIDAVGECDQLGCEGVTYGTQKLCDRTAPKIYTGADRRPDLRRPTNLLSAERTSGGYRAVLYRRPTIRIRASRMILSFLLAKCPSNRTALLEMGPCSLVLGRPAELSVLKVEQVPNAGPQWATGQGRWNSFFETCVSHVGDSACCGKAG